MLNPDYSDILRAFADAEVEYLLVGAYALAAHGHPRATGDLDLWVRASSENAQRVVRALADFGAPLAEVSAADFERTDTVFQIGVTPRRIDVLTDVDGVEFAAAWPRRMEVTLGDLPIHVIGRADLIRNKCALGRPQDLADVERLERDAPPEA